MERIAVIGCVGAGKSTVARRLGTVLSLPVVHLDRLWWEDDTYRITGPESVQLHTRSPAAFRDLQTELVAAPRWVIDGGYTADLDIRLARADTVIFLDLPRRVCFWRLLRRHNRRRSDFPDGAREGFGWLWRLVVWIYRYPTLRRPAIERAIAMYCREETTVLRLRSREGVSRFLAELGVTWTPGD